MKIRKHKWVRNPRIRLEHAHILREAYKASLVRRALARVNGANGESRKLRSTHRLTIDVMNKPLEMENAGMD